MRKQFYALICVVVAVLLLVGCSESKKYYKQAEAFRELGKYDEAIVAYQKAIEADPNYASAHYGLGLSYEQLNKFEEARKQYQKTLELNPVDSDAQRRLLCVEGKQAFNNQNYKEVINKFQEIGEALLSADEKFMIGKAYYEEGVYDKAVSLLQIAVEEVPKNEEYRYSYACALYKSRNYGKAEKEFEILADYRDSTQYRKVCIEKITPLRIETLSDFENSQFYRYYKFRKGLGWNLRSGGYNNDYDVLSIWPDVSLEVITVGDKVVGFGIMFYERHELQENDLEFVYRLLESIDIQVKLTDKIKKFIKRNVERYVFQIRNADSIVFNRFKIWVGKVGKEQTISIARLGYENQGQ